MTLTLNKTLLSVLCAIEQKRALLITESDLGLTDNWTRGLEQYFMSLPRALCEDLGLKRNLNCYRALETFFIPKGWMETESDKLNQLSFSYPG